MQHREVSSKTIQCIHICPPRELIPASTTHPDSDDKVNVKVTSWEMILNNWFHIG